MSDGTDENVSAREVRTVNFSLFVTLLFVTLVVWFMISFFRGVSVLYFDRLTPNLLSKGLFFLVMSVFFSWLYIQFYDAVSSWLGVDGDLSDFFGMDGTETFVPPKVLAVTITLAWIPLALYSTHLAEGYGKWTIAPTLLGALVAITISLVVGFYLVSSLSVFERATGQRKDEI